MYNYCLIDIEQTYIWFVFFLFFLHGGSVINACVFLYLSPFCCFHFACYFHREAAHVGKCRRCRNFFLVVCAECVGCRAA